MTIAAFATQLVLGFVLGAALAFALTSLLGRLIVRPFLSFLILILVIVALIFEWDGVFGAVYDRVLFFIEEYPFALIGLIVGVLIVCAPAVERLNDIFRAHYPHWHHHDHHHDHHGYENEHYSDHY